jgi:hypothetical protein
MNYQQAEKIRNKSFGSLLGEQEGGLGTSLKKTLSLKSQARMTGIKEKFDPLNIAKFLTGGSNFAPAALGKLFGRSKEDIARFSGSKLKDVSGTATKIGSLEGENQTLDMLMKIYEFMQKTQEDKIAQRDAENNFAEENKLEKERRHKELIEAITGKKYYGKASATKTPADDKKEEDTTIAAFGLKDFGKTALKGLGTLAKFAMGPIGAPLLAAAAIGAFGYFIYKSLKEEPSYEAEQEARGIRQAESVGGLAGVKDEEDRIKKLPEYERTMAELINYEKNYNEGEKLGEMQLAGFAKRGSESARAVEDYKAKRDGKTATPVTQTPQTPAPATEETPTSSAVPMAGGGGGTNSPTASAVSAGGGTSVAMESPNMGSQLQSAQAQNLDMQIPVSSKDPSIAINNTTKVSNTTTKEKKNLPAVRNMEETFQRMILYSTRVV